MTWGLLVMHSEEVADYLLTKITPGRKAGPFTLAAFYFQNLWGNMVVVIEKHILPVKSTILSTPCHGGESIPSHFTVTMPH